MGSEVYDVAVIGLGVMGSSTAWRLANRGAKVIGLDSYEPLHTLGSSHGRTRVIRQAYFEHPSYVPLLLSAYKLWFELQRLSSEPIINVCGGLYFGPPGNATVHGSLSSARQHHLEYELLDGQAVRSRFPHFELPIETEALFEPMAGFVHVENSLKVLHREAQSLGAELHFGSKVVNLDLTKDPITLVYEDEVVRAKKVCVTAGPWAAQLLPQFQSQLKVTRQTVGWFELGGGFLEPGSLPVFAGEVGSDFIYGIPDEGRGVKVACHNPGPVIQPDDHSYEVTESERELLLSQAKSIFGSKVKRLVHAEACKYTMSPDENFLLGSLPTDDRVCLAAGMSGHGFKFGPIIGEVLAKFAIGEPLEWDIEFLNPRRFS